MVSNVGPYLLYYISGALCWVPNLEILEMIGAAVTVLVVCQTSFGADIHRIFLLSQIFSEGEVAMVGQKVSVDPFDSLG